MRATTLQRFDGVMSALKHRIQGDVFFSERLEVLGASTFPHQMLCNMLRGWN
jgi:hypothetical protein